MPEEEIGSHAQREHEEGVEVNGVSKGDTASRVNCCVLSISYMTGSVVL